MKEGWWRAVPGGKPITNYSVIKRKVKLFFYGGGGTKEDNQPISFRKEINKFISFLHSIVWFFFFVD